MATAIAATRLFVEAVIALLLLVWTFFMRVGRGLVLLLTRLMPYILRAICLVIWAGTGVVAFVQTQGLFGNFSHPLLATYAGVIAAIPTVLSIYFGLQHGFDLWALTIWSGMFEGLLAVLAAIAPRTQGVFMIASGLYPLVLCVCMIYLVTTHKEEWKDAEFKPDTATLEPVGEFHEPVPEPGG